METQAFQQLHEDVVIYADYYTNEPQILAAGYGFEGIIGIPGLLTESQIGLAVQAGAGIISANLNQNPGVPLRNITSAASVVGVTAAGYGNVTDTFLDAMPIEFSHPLLPSTVDPTDIQITLNTGEVVQPLYAALNPNYDFNERQTMVVFGYFGNRLTPGTNGAVYPGLEEVYRLFSPLGTDRLYTTSEQERFRWEKLGYQFEGVAFYAPSFPSDSTITPVVDYQQFLRYQNPAASTPSDTINGLPLAQLFDENYYLSQMPDVASAVRNGDFLSGYQHFITFGWNEGRNPSILFDENYYRSRYSDVDLAIANNTISSGLTHFLNFGHQEQRNPSEAFSQSDYLTNNPDVAAAVNNGSLQSAFQHYITFGADEGRLPDLFLYNEADYLQHNPDVANAIASDVFADGYEHFVNFGQTEKRVPSSLYNETMYLGLNSDVANAVANGTFKSGFQHYELFGRFEERLI